MAFQDEHFLETLPHTSGPTEGNVRNPPSRLQMTYASHEPDTIEPSALVAKAQTFAVWPTSEYAGSAEGEPRIKTLIIASWPPAMTYPEPNVRRSCLDLRNRNKRTEGGVWSWWQVRNRVNEVVAWFVGRSYIEILSIFCSSPCDCGVVARCREHPVSGWSGKSAHLTHGAVKNEASRCSQTYILGVRLQSR